MPDETLLAAHQHSSHHRAEIAQSDRCGCFYCLALYPPSAIARWVDDGRTALCPSCGIDAVLGSAAGYPIDREFLAQMQAHWFGEPEASELGLSDSDLSESELLPSESSESSEAALATLAALAAGDRPDRAALDAAIAQLEGQRQRGSLSDLAGCWRLLWTSGGGRLPVAIVQCFAIDNPDPLTFTNRIELPGGGLTTHNRFTYLPRARLEFVAERLRLQLGPLRFGLPLGNWAQGWLQVTYLTDEWNLLRGDRGGLALYQRDRA